MDKKYIRFPNFKIKALTLNYDDAERQDKRLISIMQKYGLKGTFNINSGFIGVDEYKGVEKGRMSVEEVYNLYSSSGMEVAVHGYKHLDLASVDKETAFNDVVKDKKELEKIFGKTINGMAYAYGGCNEEVIKILKQCGISYSRLATSTESFDLPIDWLRFSATCHHNNKKLMELAEKFIKLDKNDCKEPKFFCLWGHSYEFDKDDNWLVIENFAKYVGNREDIWYATTGEIFKYLQACDKLDLSLEDKKAYNPTSIDLYINYLGKDLLIPAGTTIEL